MPPSTRDLLAAVLGELPNGTDPGAPVAAAPRPEPSALPTRVPLAAQADERRPSPWRVTAKMHGGKVQISNNRESRVVPKEHVETYLRGHGPAAVPER